MIEQGVIQFFDEERGFGFITPDSGGKDVFVHIKAVERSGIERLEKGDRVTFESVPGRRDGRQEAANLVLL